MIQSSGPLGIGLRPLNSPSSASNIGTYDQILQQYQHQNQSQFRLQQLSAVGQLYRDQGVKPMQTAQAASDPFGLLGLLSVIRMSDPDLTSLALGIDLTTLGLNLNSTDNLHKTFGSPWSDEPAKGDSEFTVPQCYYAKPPPPLSVSFLIVQDKLHVPLPFSLHLSETSGTGCSKHTSRSSSWTLCFIFSIGILNVHPHLLIPIMPSRFDV